jgi:hypothetical protein
MPATDPVVLVRLLEELKPSSISLCKEIASEMDGPP